MKAHVYVRIGRGRNGVKVSASTRRSFRPLEETVSGRLKPMPTVELKVNLELPDDAFRVAETELAVKLEDLGIASEVSP